MLYGVSPFAQKREVNDYCFKLCGKIIIGAIRMYDGDFFPCYEDNCPYEEKHTEVLGDLNGEECCVRKLREKAGDVK